MIATYSRPSGPLNTVGWPMIPEPVWNCQSSLPVLGVDRFEPAFEIAVENDARGGDRGAAPHRPALLDRPCLAPIDRIPGHELTGIAAGAGEETRLDADIGRAGDDVIGLLEQPVHAQIVVRHVEQPVTLLNALGLQSLAPGALGQTLRTTLPGCGIISGLWRSRPVLRSTPSETVLAHTGRRRAPRRWCGRARTYSRCARDG
jgi:hypothetical protein